MWAIYEYLENSFAGQYFKDGCDVIAVTMTTVKAHKKSPKISVFANHPKAKSVTYPFYSSFRKLPKFFKFSDGMAKSYSVELKLY